VHNTVGIGNALLNSWSSSQQVSRIITVTFRIFTLRHRDIPVYTSSTNTCLTKTFSVFSRKKCLTNNSIISNQVLILNKSFIFLGKTHFTRAISYYYRNTVTIHDDKQLCEMSRQSHACVILYSVTVTEMLQTVAIAWHEHHLYLITDRK